jgi:hypothetical protein
MPSSRQIDAIGSPLLNRFAMASPSASDHNDGRPGGRFVTCFFATFFVARFFIISES